MLNDLVTYIESLDDSIAIAENRLLALETVLKRHLPDVYRDYQFEVYALHNKTSLKLGDLPEIDNDD